MLVGLSWLNISCLGAPSHEYKGTVLEPPASLPDFELAATSGKTFHLYEAKGDIALIYFGYTYCPDVCPLTLAQVKQALAGLKTGRERVHVIFISVDPERDTAEVLKRYLAAFDPSFIGLSGDFEKIKEIMKPFGAYAEKDAPAANGSYTVSHSARLFLVDPQSQLLVVYPYDFKADDLRSDLEYLLQQEKL